MVSWSWKSKAYVFPNVIEHDSVFPSTVVSGCQRMEVHKLIHQGADRSESRSYHRSIADLTAVFRFHVRSTNILRMSADKRANFETRADEMVSRLQPASPTLSPQHAPISSPGHAVLGLLVATSLSVNAIGHVHGSQRGLHCRSRSVPPSGS